MYKCLKKYNMRDRIIGKIVRGMVKKEVFIAVSEAYELNKKELFSKQDTADMLSISTRTLDRWREEGRIKAVDTGEKGKVLFKRADIVFFLKQEGYGR